MKGQLRSYLFSPIALVQILFLSLLVFLTFLLGTSLGSQFIGKIASATLEPLEISGVEGTLFSDLKIKQLIWKTPTVVVELEKIKLDKPLFDFYKRQLDSQGISLDRLVIHLPESDDTPSEKITELPDFDLPLNIKLDSLSLKSFEVIREDDTLFEIKNMILHKPHVYQGMLTAQYFKAQPIIAGSPLDTHLQDVQINMKQPHEMQAKGRVGFAKEPQVGKLKADLDLSGTLVNYRFKLEGTLENKKISPQIIRLEGYGDYDQLELTQLKTKSTEGNLEAQAKILWTPELQWTTKGNAKAIKLAQYLPEWPAEFDATFNYDGGYKANDLYGNLQLLSLLGEVKDKKLQASGTLQHAGNQFDVDKVKAQLGDNTLTANGKANPLFDLKWNLKANDLSQVLPDLSGKLDAVGTLQGDLEKPQLNATVSAKNITYQAYHLGSAVLVATTEQGVYRLNGQVEDLKLDQQIIHQATVDASGTPEQHRFKLDVVHPDATVALKAKGGWQQQQWQGVIQQLKLDTKQVATWQLKKAVNISASQDKVSISSFCLSNVQAEMCSRVDWSQLNGVKIQGKLNRTPLALLNPWLPDDIQLKGKINGDYKLEQQQGKLVGDIALKFPASQVLFGKGNQQQAIDYKLLKVKALINGDHITANTHLLLKHKGELTAVANINLDPKGKQHQVKAKGKLKRLPLLLVKPWLPPDIQIKGYASGGYTVKLDKGNVSGDALLQLPSGTVVLGKKGSQQRIEYQSLEVKAASNGHKITANTLLKLKGKGELNANLKVILAQQGKDHDITVEGKLKQIPLALAQPWLPPDLQLKGRINGKYQAQLQKGKVVGDAMLQLPSSAVILGKRGHRQRINYQLLQIKAVSNGHKITANTLLKLKGKGELNANLKVTLAQQGKDHDITVEGKLKQIPLALAQPWLPPDLQLKGRINGKYQAQLQKGKVVGDAMLQLPSSAVILGKRGHRQRINYQLLQIKAVSNGHKITANTLLKLKGKGELNANLKVTLAQQGKDHDITVEGKLKQIPLALTQPWLPPDIQLRGRINGNYQAQLKKGKVVGDATLQLPSGAVILGKRGSQQRINYQSLQIKAASNGHKITANTQLRLKGRGELKANVNVVLGQQGGEPDVRVQGTLKQIPLALAKPWLPSDIQLNGRINGEYQARLRHKKLVGEVVLQLPASSVLLGKGRVRQRLDYQFLRIKAAANGNKINATARLLLKNKGELSANANIQLAQQGNQHHVEIKGKLRRVPLLMLKPWLPPNIQLNGRANGQYNVQFVQSKVIGDAANELPPNSVYIAHDKGKHRIDYRVVKIKAIANGNKMTANTRLVLKDNSELVTDVSVDLSKIGKAPKITLKGELSHLSLAIAKPWLPPEIQLKGHASGRYNLRLVNGQPFGEATLQLPSSVVLIGTGKNRQQIDYQSLKLNLLAKGRRISANMLLILKNKGELIADANVRLAQKGSSHQIELNGKLNRIPLAMATPWLPKNLKLNGNMKGSFQLQHHKKTLQGNVLIQLPSSHIMLTNDDGEPKKFVYEKATLKASIHNKTVRTVGNLRLKNKGVLSAKADIHLGNISKEHRVQGQVLFNMPSIRWMQPFVAKTTGLRGKISSNIQISGRLLSPRITGKIALEHGAVKLLEVGTYLRNINLSISANNANRAIIRGSLVSGQGQAKISGFIALQNLRQLKGEMRIRGTNLQFVNTHEANALMNPDILIKANPQSVDILGKIHIPNAKITLNAIPESSIDESDDVIVIGEKKKGEYSSFKMRPNVTISLGRNVKFKGFGLDAKLGGRVLVTYNKQTIITRGNLRIEKGKYQAYGQDLLVNNGRLVFNGPPTHVGVDVKALRRIEEENVVAGIHLTGTLQTPKTRLFSTPNLSKSNILSYLLTGRSLENITGNQTALLMQAVRSLNIVDGDGIMGNIGNSLGLDDLSFVAKDDLKKSELRLGKKLGSRVYVRYVVGIFDAMQKIALEYKVNKYLNLEAQAGVDTQSVDLIYKVETN